MPIEGTTALNSSSVAYVASQIVKAAPGTLYRLQVYSSLGSAQWIQLHNSATLPADAAVPVAIFKIATVADITISYADIGRYFSAGIVVCNSTTGPAKTIGAADCWFDAQYV